MCEVTDRANGGRERKKQREEVTVPCVSLYLCGRVQAGLCASVCGQTLNARGRQKHQINVFLFLMCDVIVL